jgi:PD-(D/E)XK nuclease superfamily
MQMKVIKLSPSTLNLFLECPHCFWQDKVKSIKRPRGIFPSLPGGMDRVIKAYFDSYRAKKLLPPELKGDDFNGAQLFDDQSQIDRWRNWQTGLQYRDDNGSILIGALDDLLVKAGQYIPFDYKTKGSPASEEGAVRYYQFQLDCYALLLQANGFRTTGHGFLLFYSPRIVDENGHVVFGHQAIKIPTDTERARGVFRRAVNLLKGPEPEISTECEYCGWLGKLKKDQGSLL